jgi:hypothetical protein
MPGAIWDVTTPGVALSGACTNRRSLCRETAAAARVGEILLARRTEETNRCAAARGSRDVTSHRVGVVAVGRLLDADSAAISAAVGRIAVVARIIDARLALWAGKACDAAQNCATAFSAVASARKRLCGSAGVHGRCAAQECMEVTCRRTPGRGWRCPASSSSSSRRTPDRAPRRPCSPSTGGCRSGRPATRCRSGP